MSMPIHGPATGTRSLESASSRAVAETSHTERPDLMDSVEMEIIAALRAKFGGNPQPLDSLLGLGIDSLGMAEFSAEMEHRFAVRADEEILFVETVRDLAEYIRRKIAQQK